MNFSLACSAEELLREVRAALPELARAAEAAVVEWRFADGSPLPHRPEPFLHERALLYRGGFVDAPAEERYGFDADGEVVCVRAEHTELVLRAAGIVVVVLFYEVPGGPQLICLARYRFDAGRLVLAEYRGDVPDEENVVYNGEERYVYDGAALVAIEEFAGLGDSLNRVGAVGREDLVWFGGPIEVRDGVLWREGEVLWRPAAEPFEALLEAAVPGFVEAIAATLAPWGAEHPEPVDTLWLDHRTQHDIVATTYVGVAHRHKTFPFFDGPDEQVELDDAEFTLRRHGAVAVAQPVQTVAEAVGRALLAHDWRGVLNVTDAFVVAVCAYQNDDEWTESVSRLNPPETVRRWRSGRG